MECAERFWTKVDKTDGCWDFTDLCNGYGRMRMGGRKGKHYLAHRLSYIIHHPLTIDLMEHPDICVCHRCDNPKCVNPAHLFLGTHTDNMRDKETKGRANHSIEKGEKHPRAKITEDDVREIRNKYANGGITHRQLALEYGVDRSSISSIISRKNWSYI